MLILRIVFDEIKVDGNLLKENRNKIEPDSAKLFR